MKKSSIFFSNPGEGGLDPAQRSQFLKEGAGKIEFKKKNIVIQPSKPQQSLQDKPGNQPLIESLSSNSKPLMYSSQIIKPNSEFRSGGLELLGRQVAPSQDVGGRFGAVIGQ